jgi:proline dehydrogenase
MCRHQVPIRLCKGAYKEPATVAMPKKADVDANYLKLARLLLDEGAYPALATHDPRMLDGILTHIAKTGRKSDEFEFQMLYGVRRDLQKMLIDQGYRVRLYVPYGDAWYPYFMRRLAERPANAIFVAKSMFRA